MYKILQIIPADGWKAKYKDYDGEGCDGEADLVCWALVEDKEGDQFVFGMDACDYVEFCNLSNNFKGYTK